MLLKDGEYGLCGLDENDETKRDLSAIEYEIRSVTNNGFQVGSVRFGGCVCDGVIAGSHPLIRYGDTVEVSLSGINDGLYVVESIEGGNTRLQGSLYDVPCNRVTLVRYPPDVVAGAVGILKYKRNADAKRGVASESLSRHSVTYVQPQDGLVMGCPHDVTAFLKPYMRGRF